MWVNYQTTHTLWKWMDSCCSEITHSHRPRLHWHNRFWKQRWALPSLQKAFLLPALYPGNLNHIPVQVCEPQHDNHCGAKWERQGSRPLHTEQGLYQKQEHKACASCCKSTSGVPDLVGSSRNQANILIL